LTVAPQYGHSLICGLLSYFLRSRAISAVFIVLREPLIINWVVHAIPAIIDKRTSGAMAAVLGAIIRRRGVGGFVFHGLGSSVFYVCNIGGGKLHLKLGDAVGTILPLTN